MPDHKTDSTLPARYRKRCIGDILVMSGFAEGCSNLAICFFPFFIRFPLFRLLTPMSIDYNLPYLSAFCKPFFTVCFYKLSLVSFLCGRILPDFLRHICHFMRFFTCFCACFRQNKKPPACGSSRTGGIFSLFFVLRILIFTLRSAPLPRETLLPSGSGCPAPVPFCSFRRSKPRHC